MIILEQGYENITFEIYVIIVLDEQNCYGYATAMPINFYGCTDTQCYDDAMKLQLI